MKCRHCDTEIKNLVIDLGAQPPANSYIEKTDLDSPEIYYPLKIYVCGKCFLVQTRDFTNRETFFNADYAYFSSTSSTWLEHAKKYAETIINQLRLNQDSFVVEIASNDGYLLKNFTKNDIPCLGIEPSESTASVARKHGIKTITKFFCEFLANDIIKDHGKADLITCNNVYAHVPDINDFTRGINQLLKEDGVVTVEFPHLLQLMKQCQFDTIYHEHYSYLSLKTVTKIFKKYGLKVFNVEILNTHGGSIRVYGCKKAAYHKTTSNVKEVINLEQKGKIHDLEAFNSFQSRAEAIKFELLKFLLNSKQAGKRVCAYGAAAKGNTLLNYSGIKADLLPFVSDAAASKIGRFLPGSRIPIMDPSYLKNYRPDSVIIFPWNIAKEIKLQFKELAASGCKFYTFIPKMKEIK